MGRYIALFGIAVETAWSWLCIYMKPGSPAKSGFLCAMKTSKAVIEGLSTA